MLSWLTHRRALGFGASCVVHLAIIAGVVATERWLLSVATTTPPVLLAEVVTISDAPSSPEPIPKKTPKAALRSLLHLSRPAPAAAPAAETVTPPPSPSRSSAPEPPAAPAPSAPTGAGMTAVTEPAPSAGPPAGASAPSGNGSASSRPSVASAPSRDAGTEGAITQSARPQGGYQVRPSYPSSALRQGIQGTTVLKVHVLIDGHVGDVIVQQSAGHPDLDQAAIDAVRRWRFEPARRGNDPVAMWVLLPVQFQIR